MICPHCEEPILRGEATCPICHEGVMTPYHEECVIRLVVGPAAHQLGDCSCSGSTRRDPPGLTRRQSALLAYETFQVLQGRAVSLGGVR